MLSPARSGPPGSPGPPARPTPGSRSPRPIPVRPPTQAGSVCTRHLPAAAQPGCFYRPDPGPSPCTGLPARPTRTSRYHWPSPCFRWSRPAPYAPGLPARPTHGPRAHESHRPFRASADPVRLRSNRPSGPDAFTGPIRPAWFTRPASSAHPRLTLPLAHSRASADSGRLRLHPAPGPAQLLSPARSGPLPMHRPIARPTRSSRSHWPIPVRPLVPSDSPCTRPASPVHPRPTLP
jgi:hypothetical protein